MHQFEPGKHAFIIKNTATERLDAVLAELNPYYSRSFFQKLIDQGLVAVNGKIAQKGSLTVREDDSIILEIKERGAYKQSEQHQLEVDQLKVKIIHEEPDFLIINKPAGLIVHAAHEQTEEITLVDWLTKHFEDIKTVGQADRPGIVHRLDKDTSGIMIISRNEHALMVFGDMFKNREISKTYLALVEGHPPASGSIDYPIARHPMGNKMTHRDMRGRPAQTNYVVQECLKDTSLIEAKPVTGRTHQIRVHFAAIGYPIQGDALYGKGSPLIGRQALHAYKLEFTYKNKEYVFEQEMPEDMQNLIKSSI